MNQSNSDTIPAKILIVDDIPSNLNLLSETLEPLGYNILVAQSGESALKISTRAIPDLILLDIMMPGMDGFETCRRLKADATTANIPVIFVTAKDETQSVVQGFGIGGIDYITKPFEEKEVRARVETHLKIDRLTRQLLQNNASLTEANEKLRTEIARREQAEHERDSAKDAYQKADEQLSMISKQEASRWGLAGGFVGKSKTIAKILADVQKLQNASTTSVLITGESGTGKELIARAIHFGGTRGKGAFVALNCSAIPSELAESTLFGHEKGAFTGATDSRKGHFELADGGTLFLDELGDMPLELQAKLLRTLEDGCIMPVGATRQKQVDVRILAATNAELQARIADRTFREDLYYRLARFTVKVPPLRERVEDIPLLANHFLTMFAAEMGIEHPAISPGAIEAFEAYHFPGNIREMKNQIEHALIKSGGAAIQREHLPFIERIYAYPPPVTLTCQEMTPAELLVSQKPEQADVLIIKGALAETGGDVSAAAQLLGISPAQIHRLSADTPETNLPSAPQTDEEKQVLSYVAQHGSISNAECRDLIDVDLHHASYLLKKMHRYGLLFRVGSRRWSRYRMP